jgi:hypothetical protein
MSITVEPTVYGTPLWDAVVARTIDLPSRNMSNSNARAVLAVLGIDLELDGWCGGEDATEFLGRVLIALAINPADAGIPMTVSANERGATFVECGRHEGYIDEALQDLREIAEWCRAHNVEVQWA